MDEENRNTPDMTEEQENTLRDALKERFEKLQTQSMLIGAQTMCSVINDKIVAFERQSGKKSTNDYKRVLKDIKNFVQTGLSRKINPDGTTSEKDDSETTQN